MKKTIILSAVLATTIFAKAEFNILQNTPEHIMPTSANQVLSYNKAIKDAIKSVVNISTKKSIKITKNFSMPNLPFPKEFMEPLFRHMPKSRPLQALGSGVIVTSDGYIVTNSHVIDGADEIKVTLPNSKKEYKAKVIGVDSESDLAVIKIEAKNLPAIKIANSKNLLIGDVVFAIGNPFGVGETVTSGIVSALNKDRVGLNSYENFIQTDASINPGNSGGALVDSRGALVGINSAIISKSGGNNGIGLAIPSNMVLDIAKKLIDDGKVNRGYMGISISDVTPNLKDVYTHKSGAVILDVEPDSPASKAGLKRGDLIFKIDNKNIEDATDLKRIVGSYDPKQKITIEYERDKENKSVEVTLANRTTQIASAKNSSLKGLSLSNITNELRYEYRIPSDVIGVLIKDVKPNSKAEEVGLQAGDVIIQIEDSAIKSIKDIKKVFGIYKEKPKRVYINRYGTVFMFVLK
jgi:serine protease Do